MSGSKASLGEDALVEQPAIKLFAELGWTTANLYHETFGATGTLGRETQREVAPPAAAAALRRLNPDLPDERLGGGDRPTAASTAAS